MLAVPYHPNFKLKAGTTSESRTVEVALCSWNVAKPKLNIHHYTARQKHRSQIQNAAVSDRATGFLGVTGQKKLDRKTDRASRVHRMALGDYFTASAADGDGAASAGAGVGAGAGAASTGASVGGIGP